MQQSGETRATRGGKAGEAIQVSQWTEADLSRHLAKFGKKAEAPAAKKPATPTKPRKQPSQAIVFQCQVLGLPVPVAEFRFHPTRKWRFDWAFVDQKLAIEIDGGVFMEGGGRHSRGAGYRADCEKLAEAAILGWRVIRCLPEQAEDGTVANWISRALGG